MQYVLLLRAQRHADSDLMPSLIDAVRNHAVHAADGQQQAEPTEHSRENRGQAEHK